MSVKESEPSGIKMSSSGSDLPMDNHHSTDPDPQFPRPSAPLLPSGPENPAVQDMPPPSYSSVIAEDKRSFLNVVNEQPHSMLPLLPVSGERSKGADDIEDVIIAQPTSANMGITNTEDIAENDSSKADEDPKKRRNQNFDRNTRNGADNVNLYDYSFCCINWNPTPVHFSHSNADSGEHNNHGCCSGGDGDNDTDHDCCCFGCCDDGGGDGCCDGGGGGDGCCDGGGGGDGCCDGGGGGGGGGDDCGDCNCDCTDCFS